MFRSIYFQAFIDSTIYYILVFLITKDYAGLCILNLFDTLIIFNEQKRVVIEGSKCILFIRQQSNQQCNHTSRWQTDGKFSFFTKQLKLHAVKLCVEHLCNVPLHGLSDQLIESGHQLIYILLSFLFKKQIETVFSCSPCGAYSLTPLL